MLYRSHSVDIWFDNNKKVVKVVFRLPIVPLLRYERAQEVDEAKGSAIPCRQKYPMSKGRSLMLKPNKREIRSGFQNYLLGITISKYKLSAGKSKSSYKFSVWYISPAKPYKEGCGWGYKFLQIWSKNCTLDPYSAIDWTQSLLNSLTAPMWEKGAYEWKNELWFWSSKM